MVSFYCGMFDIPSSKNEEEKMKKFIEQKAAQKLITGEKTESEECRLLRLLRSDGTRQTSVKSNERRRATKYLSLLNVSFLFLDSERAGGATDCYPISLTARTGWDDEVDGGLGNFEVFILPEGNIDRIARVCHTK